MFEKLSNSGCGARGGAGISVCGGMSYLEENQSMAIKFVQLFVAVVVLAFCVFAFDFDGGILDYRLWGKEGRVSSRTRSICRFGSSNDWVWVFLGFLCLWLLLKSLNDDFLGIDCLVALLDKQLGDFDSETGERLG